MDTVHIKDWLAARVRLRIRGFRYQHRRRQALAKRLAKPGVGNAVRRFQAERERTSDVGLRAGIRSAPAGLRRHCTQIIEQLNSTPVTVETTSESER
jgi:hypothetical protein